MADTKDIKDFTKYPSLSDNDYILGTKTDLGGSDAGITVAAFRKQVGQDIKPTIKNGYWWVDGINTGQLAVGKTPVFRKTSAGLEMKYEGEDDTAYLLIIPMADLSFSFDDLSPDQVEKLKLRFSDLTESDKESLRGEAFTYDMFTPAQLADLRLTWEKLTPEQKNSLKGERGYSAFEVWTQREGNADKTEAEYEAWLRQPATEAATRADEKLVHISEEVNQMKTDFVEDGNLLKEEFVTSGDNLQKAFVTAGTTLMDALSSNADKVNTDLTAVVDSLKEQAETVILETTRVKEATETATDNADEATKAAIAATGLVASAVIDAKAATKLAADASVLAEQKAGLANTAAGVAGAAAEKADTATEKADTATTNAENAAIRLDSLSDHRDVIRDGYWWHWNEELNDYEKTANRADGNTLFASFDVDPVTGELSVTTPDGYDGPLFELDSNGYLSVIV